MGVEQAVEVSVWGPLLPVIVGGIIGVAGGLAGPPLAHWLNERADKKKRRAEKFEDLVGALYAHNHWLNLMKDIRLFGEPDTHPASPLPRAEAISSVYFPHLNKELVELSASASQYELWMLEAAKKRLSGDMKGINDGLNQAYSPYSAKFAKLTSDLRDYAQREFR